MDNTRIAIYGRVSTRDKGQDTENQMCQLRAFAGALGCIVIHEYVDHAIGKTGDREACAEMFAAASRHEFSMLLFLESGSSFEGGRP